MLAIGISFVSLILGIFNLLMLFAVLNRLKESGSQLPGIGSSHSNELPVGAPVPVPSDDEQQPTLVAFFAPGCPACDKLLPAFAEVATAHPDGPDRVAVVITAGMDASRYTAKLGQAVRTITGGLAKDYIAAYQVIGFPVVCRLSPSGVLLWSAHDAAALNILSARLTATAPTPSGARA